MAGKTDGGRAVCGCSIPDVGSRLLGAFAYNPCWRCSAAPLAGVA